MNGITWFPAINRWHDQTGVAHAMRDDETRTVCGARPFSLGGGFTTAEQAGAHECRKCRRILDSKGEATTP